VSIAADFEAATKKYVERAGPAIESLAKLAEALKMPTARDSLMESHRGLTKPEFWLIVLGRMKNGKSTFLNVLLGRLTRPIVLSRPINGRRQIDGGVLPMDDLPATARLTTIRYGDQLAVTVVRKDNTRERKSFDWFIEQSSLKPSEQANATAFGEVAEFELSYPFENGKAGIVLLDSPGTDEDAERTMIAQRAINKCDAAIMLFRSDSLLGEYERAFVQDMMARGLRSFFTVVNRWSGRPVDERLRSFVWDRRVTQLEGGQPYSGQDFASKKIYFIDARTALNAKLAGDTAGLAASGMEAFEKALHRYFEKERRKVHVLRWVDQADGEARGIEAFVHKTVPALKREKEDLQRKFEELRPRVEVLRARKGKVGERFVRFYDRCHTALMTAFEELILRIRDDLTAHMRTKVKLKSMENFGSLIWSAVSRAKREEAAKEASAAAVHYIETRIAAWCSAAAPAPGPQQVLAPLIDDFMVELKAEVDDIELQFNKLHFALTGYTPTVEAGGNSDEPRAWWSRIAPTAVGLAFGPDLAVFGARDGWKGMGKGILVHMGVGITAAFLVGGPLGWGALATVWAVAFLIRAVWKGSEIERQMKEEVARNLVMGGEYEELDPVTKNKVIKRFEGLRGEPRRAGPKMRKALVASFAEFERALTEALGRKIDQEIQTFEEMQRNNSLKKEEKTRLVEKFEKALAETSACRKSLADARRMAEATL
jgi:hypothetical protein